MKKINLLFFTTLVIAFGVFNSCDKDDQEINYDPELIGTWRTEYSLEEITQIVILTLNENLTGFTQSFPKEDPNNDKRIFNYTADGNTLNIIHLSYATPTNSAIIYTYSASGNILILTINGETFTHKKVESL